MITVKRPLRWLCALMALIMMGLPAAMAEGSFEAVVSAESMKVYAQTAPHAVIATLTKGTTVTVNAWSGRAALISHDSVTGIARVSDMRRADAAQDASSPKTMVTNRNTRIADIAAAGQ